MANYDAALEHLGNLNYETKVFSTVILVAEALNRGISVAKTQTGKGLTLSFGNRTRTWRTGRIPLNSMLSRRLCNFKNATSALLAAQGVAAADNRLFGAGQQDEAWRWAEQRLPVVIKPNNGLQGRDVQVGIDEPTRFGNVYSALARKYGRVLVEKQYTGVQYRCFFVARELVAAAEMRPASVVGDGRSTTSKLIEEKNVRRRGHRSHWPLPSAADPYLDLPDPYEHVPAHGERVHLTEVSNLQRGGDAIDSTESMTVAQLQFLQSVTAAIPDLRIAGIDVILGAGAPENIVLEINANPQMSIHHLPWEGQPRNVAHAVVDELFPETAVVSADITAKTGG